MQKSQLTRLFQNVSSWDSLLAELKSEDNKTKGDAFELLVKHYLLSDPVYQTKLADVWMFHEIPSEVARYLNLPSNDQGIDLVAKTHNGEYWAIQCKFKMDASQSLTWREVSTFTGLTFGICNNFKFGLICTTGERFARILNTQENIGLCTNETWSKLPSSFFAAVSTSRPVSKPELYKPRPHQKIAIERTNSYFRSPLKSRGKLIMPCGTGKSLTSYWIDQAMDTSTTLVAVPSISLLRQTMMVWLRQIQSDSATIPDWICVCSDVSITEISRDEMVTLPQDLGIPVSTSSIEIQKWLERTSSSKKRIIFTTYQSGRTISTALNKVGAKIDLGILDEAHKTVGRIDGLFSHLLFDTNIVMKNRLFMTATERRYVGKSSQIASMENEEIYGSTINLLSFKDALKQKPKIIVDYKVLTLYISKREIAELILKNSVLKSKDGDWDGEIEAEMLASIIAIKKAAQYHPIKHAISFHSSIAKAKDFKRNLDIVGAHLPNLGTQQSFHISGRDPSSVRQRTLRDFEQSSSAIITNARCLTEGVDIPNVDCVMFADPKKSKVDIVQALGRALRPSPGKEFGYIILPVVVDEEKDIEEFLNSDAYANLVITLRALASNDERIIDYFRDRATDGSSRFSMLHEDHISADLSKLINFEDFSNAIGINCWESLSKLSYKSFTSARRFVRSLGLHSQLEWTKYCEGVLHKFEPSPSDIPTDPISVYKSEWKGWDDWLSSNDRIKGAAYYKFDVAKQLVHRRMYENTADWHKQYNPKEFVLLPPNPDIIYHENWSGWDDWLFPAENKTLKDFRSAHAVSLSLKLATKEEWYNYRLSKDDNHGVKQLPYRPDRAYIKEWQGWDHWLGQAKKAPQVLANSKKGEKLAKEKEKLEDAKKFVHRLHLQSKSDWRKYRLGQLSDRNLPAMPFNMPTHPDKHWKRAWVSWEDWLGLPTSQSVRDSAQTQKAITPSSSSSGDYIPFNLARAYVRRQRLTTIDEYIELIEAGVLPDYIPSNPAKYYAEDWNGWEDWLGSNISELS